MSVLDPLFEAACNGDAEAQVQIAEAFLAQDTTDSSTLRHAEAWARVAAANGHPRGLFRLGAVRMCQAQVAFDTGDNRHSSELCGHAIAIYDRLAQEQPDAVAPYLGIVDEVTAAFVHGAEAMEFAKTLAGKDLARV